MAKDKSPVAGVGDVLPEARFFDENLDDAKPPRFEYIDEIAVDLTTQLEASRMLVLGGYQLEDKRIFARHIAWSLGVRLGRQLPVKHWRPDLSPHNFDAALRQFTGETILLFPGVLTRHLGYDLRRLHAEVCRQSKPHYAIVTTDSRLEEWGVGTVEKHLWRELKTEDIYSTGFLTRLLDYELSLKETEIQGDHTILAKQLGTPSRVLHFAQLARVQTKTINRAWIDDVLKQLSGDGHRIKTWYEGLSIRLKSLALSLAMLDGFYRDQAFEALHILVVKVWRTEYPGFATFNAAEMAELGAYFSGLNGSEATSKIACASAGHRREILKTARSHNERQFRGVLAAIAGIAARSGLFGSPAGLFADPPNQAGAAPAENNHVDQNDYAGWLPNQDRILFGSQERIQHVQWSASVLLSETGKHISRSDAEQVILYDLVVYRGFAENEENEKVAAVTSSVAASALALWREIDPDDPEARKPEIIRNREESLYKQLDKWCSQAFELEIGSFCKGNPIDSFACARATVALGISYAAFFDKPNELAPQLFNLFKKLCQDRHRLVQQHVRAHTLPWLMALHPRQVECIFREKPELLEEDGTRNGIAQGLAAAYLIQPEKALPILNAWYEEGLTRNRRRPEMRRLSVALEAFGWIAARQSPAEDSLHHEILDRLKRAFRRDRRSVVQALIIQAENGVNNADSILSHLVRKLNDKERESLMSVLVEVYLRQRNYPVVAKIFRQAACSSAAL